MEVTIQLGSGCEPLPGLKVYLRSEPGDRPDNQDAALHRWVGDHWVGVVADGAGGYRGGQVASSLVANGLIAQFAQNPTLCPSALRGMVESVNAQLREAQLMTPDHASMHSTVCLLVIHGPTLQAIWLHVGDTRIYHFRNQVCLSRSKDHSVLQWLQDTAPQLEKPSRNALYTAMGQSPENLLIDVLPTPCALQPGDWLLLCTDGVWESFSNEELALLEVGIGEHRQLTGHLHALALQRAGGHADNLTSLAVMIP